MPKLWLLATVAVAITLVAAGVWFQADQARALRNRAEANLTAVARLKIDQIEQWREDRLADGQRVTGGHGLAALVGSWLDEPTAARTADMQDTLESLRYGGRYSEVLLVDSRGRVLLSTDSGRGDVHRQVLIAMPAAAGARRAVLTELHRLGDSGGLHLDVVAPLTLVEPQDGVSYAILLHAHADDFLFPLVNAWPLPSETAETLLVRRDGDEVLYLNDVRHAKDTALHLRRPLSDDSLPAARAILGVTGVMQGVDYRGEEVLAYLSRVPGSDWYMVSKVDTAEAFAELRSRSWLVGLLVVSVVGLVLGSGVAAWQQTTNQQLARLLEVERGRSAAEERYRVTLDSVGDAVIATDAECRVEFMNSVAEDLTGWSVSEAVGRPLETVFDILNEYTREPVESPATRVMREGIVVGLANHTLLRSRSGEERAIADSGAPIRDASGVVTGAVLVFRDQTAEREAEKALVESEERFRALVEQGPIAVFVQTEGRFAYLNPAAVALFGASGPEDLLGQPVLERIHPDYRDKVAERIRGLNENRESQPAVQETFLALDGRPVTVEASAAPITYGGTQGAVVLAQDMSARLRTEGAQRARTELLEKAFSEPIGRLLQRCVDAVCQLLESPVGFFHFVESGGERISFGAWSTETVEEFCQADPDATHYPVSESGVWADAVRQARAVIHNDFARVEGRKGTPAGHVDVTRELVVPVLRDGEVVAVLGVGNKDTEYTASDLDLAHDLANVAWEVAEHKRADEAWRNSQHLLRIAAGLTHLGGWSVDLAGERLEWSEEVCRIHGVPPDHVPSVEEAIEFYTAESRQVIADCFRRCCEKGLPYDVELEIVRRDGERVWVRTAGEAARDESGDVVRVHGGFQDITQRKRVEDELRQYREHLEDLVAGRTRELEKANRRLEEATRAKSRFLANMSHELRTPLNAIIGFSSLLDQRLAGDLNEEQSYQVKTILSAGRHLLSLIADVLDLSKVEAGSVEVHVDEFDPTELLTDVVGTLEPLALDKGLRLTCDSQIPGARLCSDAGKVRQILMNLIGNAIKFTNEGWVEIHLDRDDRGVAVFAVRDTGKGIDADDLPLVFEAFRQVEDSGMVKPEGTGLGLAISQEYARLLGGSIDAESEPGVGSIFRLRLPLNGR